jgi:flagellar hook-basal body complex protein FliE
MEDEINIGICKSITINKKMYKNFMGILVGDEALDNLKNEPLDVDKAAEVKKKQIEHFEETLISSLNHVVKTLKNLKKLVEDAAQQKEKRKYMSSQHVKVRKAD